MKKIFQIILVASVFLGAFNFLPAPAQASGATLSLSPSSSLVALNGTVMVTVNVSSSQALNSASGIINYPNSVLTADSVSTSGSIFSFWTSQPAAGTGSSIIFGGGLPTPGFAGNGKIFSITFKAISTGSATISLTGGQVLANDGAGTSIFGGASGATITVSPAGSSSSSTVNKVVTAPALVGLTVSSSTHPKQSDWYKTKDAVLNWNKPSDITSFGYTLASSGNATKTGSGAATTANFTNLSDGVWTFTLTGQSVKQTRTTSYKIQIDATAPDAFTIKVTQTGSTDPRPTIDFGATDSTSGIDHYVVTVDGQNSKQVTDTSLKLDLLLPGHHQVSVVAFDKAGNSTASNIDLQVEGFPGPTITGASKFVSVLEPISLQGQALYGAKVRLYIDGKVGPDFTVKENLSDHQRQTGDQTSYKDDTQVEWSYYYRGVLTPGKHTFSAIQIKPDESQSNLSNTVTASVLWSSVTLFGQTLPLAIVSIGLLIVIVFLLAILLWLAEHSKRAVVGWKDRLLKLRKKVDNNLREMENDVTSAVNQLKNDPEDLSGTLEKKVERRTAEIDKEIDATIQTAEKEESKKN